MQKSEHKETGEFEQKPLKNFDEFSVSEEQEIKQHAEKQLAKRREKAEELKVNKRKQKSEENAAKEGELNGKFKEIRQLKIESKKMLSAVLEINCK